MNVHRGKRTHSRGSSPWCATLVWAVLVCAGLGLTALGASAQTIRFPAGSNGRVIAPSEIEPGDLVRIGVEVELPIGADCADYLVAVGSSDAQTVCSGTVLEVALGPTEPSWFVGYSWPEVPFGTVIADPLNPSVPLLARLAYMSTPSTTTIVSVDRVVMFDGRIVSQESAAPENPTSLVSQLSPAGLEKLEPTHEEPLPWPSMADFNSTMTANMSRVDRCDYADERALVRSADRDRCIQEHLGVAPGAQRLKGRLGRLEGGQRIVSGRRDGSSVRRARPRRGCMRDRRLHGRRVRLRKREPDRPGLRGLLRFARRGGVPAGGRLSTAIAIDSTRWLGSRGRRPPRGSGIAPRRRAREFRDPVRGWRDDCLPQPVRAVDPVDVAAIRSSTGRNVRKTPCNGSVARRVRTRLHREGSAPSLSARDSIWIPTRRIRRPWA